MLVQMTMHLFHFHLCFLRDVITIYIMSVTLVSIQDFCHDKEFARVDTNSGRRFKTQYSEARGDDCCLRRWNGFFGR